ncbi:MAG: molybdenum cofactor biosynthesis protein MoaE [Actinomycetota bacterium]
MNPPDGSDWIELTRDPLDLAAVVAWATVPACGAVVSFSGVVREFAEGRSGVTGMTYEAYEEPARRALAEIVAAARRTWPDVERIALLHRTGDLALTDASVVVVVASPHRRTAFAAAEFAIDTLKRSVPIWKQEHWAGGSDWAVEQHPIAPVAARSGSASRPAT